MIRLSTHTATGQRLIMLILEPDNLTRLRQDNPIRLDLRELVPELSASLDLVITYDADPEALASRLRAEYRIDHYENRRGGTEHETSGAPQEFKAPRCPHCDHTFTALGMFTAEDKRTGFFFCPACGCTIGAQYFGRLP